MAAQWSSVPPDALLAIGDEGDRRRSRQEQKHLLLLLSTVDEARTFERRGFVSLWGLQGFPLLGVEEFPFV
jgi:hypothetical protein